MEYKTGASVLVGKTMRKVIYGSLEKHGDIMKIMKHGKGTDNDLGH